MAYTPEGDRLHALFSTGLERLREMTDTTPTRRSETQPSSTDQSKQDAQDRAEWNEAMADMAKVAERGGSLPTLLQENQAIADLRQNMAYRAEVARQASERANPLVADPAPVPAQAITVQVTDALLDYAEHFGQPMMLAFATRVALVLRDKGLLARD